MIIMTAMLFYQASLLDNQLIQERVAPEPFNVNVEGQCGRNLISIKYGTKNRQNGFSISQILVNNRKINASLISKINSNIPMRFTEGVSITECLNRDDGAIALISVNFSESAVVRDRIKKTRFFFVGKNFVKFE